MKEKLNAIVTDAMAKLEKVEQLDVLNDIRVNYLGKKGELTSVLKSMKDVAPEDRPAVGQMVNDARIKLENKIEEVKQALVKKAREIKMASETIDVTLPAKTTLRGHRHPNTIALEEVRLS